MSKTQIAKIAGIAVGATVAFGSFVPMAGAVTVAELQAQINALMAQLSALQGGSTTSSSSFTQNLTVGSTGSEVVALQQYLVAQGKLVMPAGVAYGYFGPLTQAATAAWQTANGVSPAAGYWGPVSRAKHASLTGGSTTTTTPVNVGSITTPGAEGTVTVSVNPSPAAGTKLYEGEGKKQVFGIKLEAKNSDVRIERVKIDLDSVTNTGDNLFYTKISDMIYVMDGSTVLASSALNSSTVVKDGSDYFITVPGLSFVVPKDATKVLYVALDARSSWDTTYDNDTWSMGVPVDGVRGVDGAGVNQYGPTTAFSREFTSAADLVDSATLLVSLNISSPKSTQVMCTSSSDEDECDELEVAKFNFKAEKDEVLVTDFVLDLVRGATTNTATSTTAYLYDGSTLVGSASVAGTSLTVGTATFSDIDWTVPKDTTKVLSIRLDIRDAGAAGTTFVASTDAADVTSENSTGTAITASGSADGNTFTVRKVGPEITLVSKSITTDGVPQGSPALGVTSTSTLTSTFTFKIKAVGGDIMFGTVASGTPAFASSTSAFQVYVNGASSSEVGGTSTSTSYSFDTTKCQTDGTNTCTLAEGAEVTVPVTFQIYGRSTKGGVQPLGVYSVQFTGLQWVAKSNTNATTTTFMSTDTDWRTADVSFP